MTEHPYIQKTLDALTPHLVGQRIKAIGYIDKESCEAMDWYETTLVITLENGVQLYASQDDEGNGPGSMFTSIVGPLETIGVVPV